MNCIFIIFALLPAIFALPSIGTTQSTAVRGILLCNGKPSVGTKVSFNKKKNPSF